MYQLSLKVTVYVYEDKSKTNITGPQTPHNYYTFLLLRMEKKDVSLFLNISLSVSVSLSLSLTLCKYLIVNL